MKSEKLRRCSSQGDRIYQVPHNKQQAVEMGSLNDFVTFIQIAFKISSPYSIWINYLSLCLYYSICTKGYVQTVSSFSYIKA